VAAFHPERLLRDGLLEATFDRVGGNDGPIRIQADPCEPRQTTLRATVNRPGFDGGSIPLGGMETMSRYPAELGAGGADGPGDDPGDGERHGEVARVEEESP
jgi:hypothetical protein